METRWQKDSIQLQEQHTTSVIAVSFSLLYVNTWRTMWGKLQIKHAPAHLNKNMKKIIILLCIIPSFAFASIDTNVKYGDRTSAVFELQDFLVFKGLLNVPPTGFFGLLTLKAVKSYQLMNEVPSTGYVGALTRAKINTELVTELADSLQEEGKETPQSVNPPQTQQPNNTCVITEVDNSSLLLNATVEKDKELVNISRLYDPMIIKLQERYTSLIDHYTRQGIKEGDAGRKQTLPPIIEELQSIIQEKQRKIDTVIAEYEVKSEQLRTQKVTICK